MKYILISTLVILYSTLTVAETFNLNFKKECVLVPNASLKNNYFYVQTVLKLNGSGSKKLYQIQCMLDSKKCFGVDLSLNDKEIGMLGLVPQTFDANTVNISESSATFIYNNVTFNVDKKDNSVKMVIYFKSAVKNGKDLEERWEGVCN